MRPGIREYVLVDVELVSSFSAVISFYMLKYALQCTSITQSQLPIAYDSVETCAKLWTTLHLILIRLPLKTRPGVSYT